METSNDIELHDLETIEASLSAEGSAEPHEAGFEVASASGFLVASASGFLVA
jgi:hypothetical protein